MENTSLGEKRVHLPILIPVTWAILTMMFVGLIVMGAAMSTVPTAIGLNETPAQSLLQKLENADNLLQAINKQARSSNSK